jgi:hypothetical protein
MCSLPNLTGDFTDFRNKWNPEIVSSLYGFESPKLLDGEYIDSSEGYVTKELDYRRDHFAAATTPLTFDARTGQPALFRGLIAFEYAQAIARDVHGLGKLMMANATPHRLPWLTSCFDVLGTETNWNYQNQWHPMEIEEMFYRRALCKGKPYCFLMNSDFSAFTHEMTEKFMKRSLAFGMFPGFFSADASTGHYFTNPELYERDRELFKKYVPLCKRVSEAGWEPIPKITSNIPAIVIERFGEDLHTIFNPTAENVSFALMLSDDSRKAKFENLVTGERFIPDQGRLNLTLASDDVAILDIQ